MLIPFTESSSGNAIFVNPEYVVAVFVASDEQNKGKTVISLINGNLVTDMDQTEVSGQINGALNG
mgnify:CR=1 FL=1